MDTFRRWGVVMLLWASGVALLGAPAASLAQDPCAGLVEPRLALNGSARVIATYGLSLKDRAAPGTAGSTEVDLLTYGTVATVIENYHCNYGYVWWKFRLPNGTVGWAAEGSDSTYFLEPVTVGLHTFQPQNEGAEVVHSFITPDGAGAYRDTLVLPVLNNTPESVWQQVELDYLAETLAALAENCPDKLAGTPFENVPPADILQMPLPENDYDLYPAPDGSRLVVVRHQHVRVPRCDNVVPQRVGVSLVSVIDTAGARTELFPFPQHGSIPDSVDTYQGGEPSEFSVYFEDVTWSPQGRYIAFTTAYRYACNRQDCYRFHLYIWDMEAGQLYVLGEGRRLSWTNGGQGVNFFRLSSDGAGNQVPRLYSARPDGSARQEIWLPGGAIYLSDAKPPLDLPWSADGTRVMVENRPRGEVMLFKLADRDFTPVVTLPDLATHQANRLAVHALQGDKVYLWATIRGEFVRQNARTGDWVELNSELASTGVAPARVRPFADEVHVLVEMVDGSAHVLNIDTDEIVPVTFGE